MLDLLDRREIMLPFTRRYVDDSSIFCFDLTKNGIIPEMEKRIFNLNVTVSNNKKGVKNVLKSLWRNPKEGDTVGLASKFSGRNYAVKYTYDQIESQVRLLADSLFLMKDYEAALSTHRLVKGDYASDKVSRQVRTNLRSMYCRKGL